MTDYPRIPARVFIAECNDSICGFCAILTFPHPKKKNTYREHRVVVLPDFQGVGIGRMFTNYIAELYKKNGKTMINTTSNPAMIRAKKNDAKWAMTRKGRTDIGSCSGKIQNKHIKGSTSIARITCSFEYVG